MTTKEPTVLRIFQRFMFSLSTYHPGMEPFLRDIYQTYTQSDTTLESDVYISPPVEMGMDNVLFFNVINPLYGIPGSGLNCCLTYLDRHLSRLGMF